MEPGMSTNDRPTETAAQIELIEEVRAPLLAEISRLRGIIASAAAAMDSLHPEASSGEMTDAEYASLWNATVEMLSNG
jgi:citrate lyase beta subunit